MSTARNGRSTRWARTGRALAGIGLISARVGALAAAPAQANRVGANEELGCDGGEVCDVDTFEIKCTQSASVLCVSLEHNSPMDHTFMASLVATAPASMLGQAALGTIPLGTERIFCLWAAPGKDVAIKGLLSVTLVPYVDVNQKSFHIEAECFTGDIINGLASRGTSVKLKHDE